MTGRSESHSPSAGVATERVQTRPRKRVQAACERCRRHKLKCGNQRPCPLCLHSDVPCVPQSRSRKRASSFRFLNSGISSQRQVPDDQQEIARGEGPNDYDHGDDNAFVPLEDAQGNEDGRAPTAPSVLPARSHLPENGNAVVDEGCLTETQGHARDGLPMQTGNRAEAFRQRASSFGIFRQIVDEFIPDMAVHSSMSALPGAQQTRATSPIITEQGSGLEEVLGMKLPSKPETDFLIESYLNSVHWFMMLFHEASFRARYESIFVLGGLDRAQRRFAILLLLILGLGAHYAEPEQLRAECPGFNALEFQKSAIKKVEEHLLGLFDDVELESVQICVLLASYYLYHGRPNLGFVVLGSGIRCAQSISLHYDEQASNMGPLAQQERRRAWWALYIFDRFASIVYGRPVGINETEYSVRVPEDMEDTGPTDFHHQTQEVSLFTYTKHKIELYRISSSIVGDPHFFKTSDVTALHRKIQKVDQRLENWSKRLPPELRLEKINQLGTSPVVLSNKISMQALALQIAYDNILMVLHRPMFTHAVEELAPSNLEHDDSSSLRREDHLSRRRCWEAALRTSNLGRYQSCFQSARQSHAASFLGINLFTSGMVLSVVALSKPLSEHAQMSKRAIGRILSLSKLLESRALLAVQTSKVLSDMVRLILDKEMKALLGSCPYNGTSKKPPEVNTQSDRARYGNSLDPSAGDPQSIAATVAGPYPARSPGVQEASMDLSHTNGDGGRDGIATTDFCNLSGDSIDPLAVSSLDLESGLQFLQQAMYHPSEFDVPEFTPDDGGGYSFGYSFGDGRVGSASGGLDVLGQSWLWEPNKWPDFTQ